MAHFTFILNGYRCRESLRARWSSFSARSHTTLMLLATTCEFFISFVAQLLRGRRCVVQCVPLPDLLAISINYEKPSPAVKSSEMSRFNLAAFIIHSIFSTVEKCAWNVRSWLLDIFELTCEILRYFNAFLPAVAAGLGVDRMINFVALQVSIEQEQFAAIVVAVE